MSSDLMNILYRVGNAVNPFSRTFPKEADPYKTLLNTELTQIRDFPNYAKTKARDAGTKFNLGSEQQQKMYDELLAAGPQREDFPAMVSYGLFDKVGEREPSTEEARNFVALGFIPDPNKITNLGKYLNAAPSPQSAPSEAAVEPKSPPTLMEQTVRAVNPNSTINGSLTGQAAISDLNVVTPNNGVHQVGAVGGDNQAATIWNPGNVGAPVTPSDVPAAIPNQAQIVINQDDAGNIHYSNDGGTTYNSYGAPAQPVSADTGAAPAASPTPAAPAAVTSTPTPVAPTILEGQIVGKQATGISSPIYEPAQFKIDVINRLHTGKMSPEVSMALDMITEAALNVKEMQAQLREARKGTKDFGPNETLVKMLSESVAKAGEPIEKFYTALAASHNAESALLTAQAAMIKNGGDLSDKIAGNANQTLAFANRAAELAGAPDAIYRTDNPKIQSHEDVNDSVSRAGAESQRIIANAAARNAKVNAAVADNDAANKLNAARLNLLAEAGKRLDASGKGGSEEAKQLRTAQYSIAVERVKNDDKVRDDLFQQQLQLMVDKPDPSKTSVPLTPIALEEKRKMAAHNAALIYIKQYNTKLSLPREAKFKETPFSTELDNYDYPHKGDPDAQKTAQMTEGELLDINDKKRLPAPTLPELMGSSDTTDTTSVGSLTPEFIQQYNVQAAALKLPPWGFDGSAAPAAPAPKLDPAAVKQADEAAFMAQLSLADQKALLNKSDAEIDAAVAAWKKTQKP